MNKIHIVGSLVLCLAFTLSIFAITPPEQSLKKKDVPQSIIKSFEQSYPQAKIKGYSKEDNEGKVAYEIESKDGKINRDILYNADGSVISIEESMLVSELPQLVQNSLKSEFSNAKIIQVERLIKGSEQHFEVILKVKKLKFEIMFGADGKIIKKEKV